MGELINGRTPEEIITGLKCEVTCSKCAYREHNFMNDDSCDYYVEQDVIALIKHLEAERDAALEKVPKWISVKERLPEAYQCVMVHVRHTEKWRNNAKLEKQWHVVEEDCWLGDGWECNADTDIHEVTHWMPKPQPPEEE